MHSWKFGHPYGTGAEYLTDEENPSTKHQVADLAPKQTIIAICMMMYGEKSLKSLHLYNSATLF